MIRDTLILMVPFARNGIQLQDRDLEILGGLFECRVMTLAHIAEFYFDGKSEAAKKRVQKLKAAGYLRERKRRLGDPSFLHIGTKAFTALKQRGNLEQFPNIGTTAFEKRAQVSDLTLRHELDVMTVRAAFFRAVREHPALSIVQFSTWPALFQFSARHLSSVHGRRELLLKPDGFIRIHEKTLQGTIEHMFFLEVDRSTESQEIVAQKAACYIDFYHSGGMALRHGKPRQDFKSFPFRTLMVFKTVERRNNALRRLCENMPPVMTLAWAATLRDVSKSPLAAIWKRPKDWCLQDAYAESSNTHPLIVFLSNTNA